MTVQELIRDYDFTANVRNEMFIAYDENPEGFERLCLRVAKLKNPPAALTSMVRSGQHMKDDQHPGGGRPTSDTLDDVVAIALTAYNARVAKYPLINERGWTQDDAIIYAVDVAHTWATRIAPDDIERALRIRLGCPWTSETDTALGTGCPPELRDRILTKLRGFGDMPDEKKEPTLKIDANELAQRLLAELGEAA